MAKGKRQLDVLEIVEVLRGERPMPGEHSDLITIDAGQVQVGTQFKEFKDSKGATPGLVRGTSPCATEYNNVHLKTSRGDWCVAIGHQLIHLT